MENLIKDQLQESFYNLTRQLRGFKNAEINIEQDCPNCDGTGKMFAPPMDLPDKIEKIDCTRCNGSGGVNVEISINVVKTPAQKFEIKRK